jgi:hypothetical protein
MQEFYDRWDNGESVFGLMDQGYTKDPVTFAFLLPGQNANDRSAIRGDFATANAAKVLFGEMLAVNAAKYETASLKVAGYQGGHATSEGRPTFGEVDRLVGLYQHYAGMAKASAKSNGALSAWASGMAQSTANRAIQGAIALFGINTVNTRGVGFDPGLGGRSHTDWDRKVRIGDHAFTSAGMLGAWIGHEAEVHAVQMRDGMTPKLYNANPHRFEVQAYRYMVDNSERFQLSASEQTRVRERYNDELGALYGTR